MTVIGDNGKKGFERLIDYAPHVTCLRCAIEMNLRALVPAAGSEYIATYRCPKCGTDTQREFTVHS